MKLTSLHIYPVKSCQGLTLQELVIDKKGPQGDRRWMIVDETGRFMSQRKFPQMALIGAALHDQELELTIPGSGLLRVPIQGTRLQVEVWKDTVPALDQGEEAVKALSSFLQTGCRLVYLDEASIRPVHPDYAVSNQDQVSFADGFPFLIISEASLEDLNSRLKTPVPMDRFRPNLVVSGCKPYEEDAWKEIRIGNVHFRVVKPCSRCVLTTVDQKTGEKGLEPLQTLSTYRKMDKGIMFGQNAIHLNQGRVRLGDLVEVIA